MSSLGSSGVLLSSVQLAGCSGRQRAHLLVGHVLAAGRPAQLHDPAEAFVGDGARRRTGRRRAPRRRRYRAGDRHAWRLAPRPRQRRRGRLSCASPWLLSLLASSGGRGVAPLSPVRPGGARDGAGSSASACDAVRGAPSAEKKARIGGAGRAEGLHDRLRGDEKTRSTGGGGPLRRSPFRTGRHGAFALYPTGASSMGQTRPLGLKHSENDAILPTSAAKGQIVGVIILAEHGAHVLCVRAGR